MYYITRSYTENCKNKIKIFALCTYRGEDGAQLELDVIGKKYALKV